MDDVKLKTHSKLWGKKMCGFIMREWKKRICELKTKWVSIFDMIRFVSVRNTFMVISEEMKQEILRNRIKNNLSRIYSKKFRHNANLAFRIWRICNLNKKVV